MISMLFLFTILRSKVKIQFNALTNVESISIFEYYWLSSFEAKIIIVIQITR